MEATDEGEWLDFRTAAPELAETGERLFFQGSEGVSCKPLLGGGRRPRFQHNAVTGDAEYCT